MAEKQTPPKVYTKKEAQVSDVELVTPFDTRITVPRRRADSLLARSAQELPNGKRAKYRLAEDVDKPVQPQKPGGEK